MTESPAPTRKVHFSDNTHVQFLGEFTCIRSDEHQPHGQKEQSAESSFISCLLLPDGQQAPPLDLFADPCKTSNPDLLQCSSGDKGMALCPGPAVCMPQRGGPLRLDSGCSVSPCGELCARPPVPGEETAVDFCEQCDCCRDALAGKFITKNTVTYATDSNCAVNTRTGSVPPSGAGSHGPANRRDSNLYSFIPFLLVTGILSITLALLVSVSIIYIQCKYNDWTRYSVSSLRDWTSAHSWRDEPVALSEQSILTRTQNEQERV